jgi:putative ABC transport system permease protein
MAIRVGLVKEVVVMALDTVRTNKMRSGLTVLGVVIGITSIVGMTALIRGFDESIRDLLRTVGPTTITITRFSIGNLTTSEVRDLLKRPNLTVSDARALETQASTAKIVDIELGASIGPRTQQRVFYRDQKTKQILVIGTGERFAEGALLPFIAGRFFNGTEVQYRKNVVVLGNTAYRLLFEPSGIDPIGKLVRVGNERFEVVGVLGKRANAGGFSNNADDFVVVPYTAYERIYGLRAVSVGRGGQRLGSIVNIQFTVLPHDGISQKDALDDIRRVMRIRHGLKLDQPDDFDLGTQDSLMQLYNSISQATFFALVVISSIALMVGGIGVMAIMSITVTERTREIGVRKALGARRVEILFQFLMEAAVLTSVGGILGIGLGSLIGLSVHWISGFPISLPWWSFALGLGFSASVGIFFGMYPAFKASRLDPIEALRYE